MPHFSLKQSDGKYVHGCNECGYGLKGHENDRYVAFRCRCRHAQTVQGPTVSIGKRPTVKPPRNPFRITLAKPKCAFLGAPLGDPVKISCGNTWKQPQECLCPNRVAKISRTGKILDKLAAWGWWCHDNGPAPPNDYTPVVLKYCQTCPHYEPQKLVQLLLTADV